MLDKLDALIAGEALACRVKHDPGEVNADANDLGTIAFQQREQATVARPEVKDTTSAARYRAVREPVRPVEITTNTLGDGPLAGRHARIIGYRRVAGNPSRRTQVGHRLPSDQ